MRAEDENEILDQEDEQTRSVIRSFQSSRIWLPIFIGLGVVIYLLFRNFDAAALKTIQWSAHSFFWLVLSVFFLLVRHVAYALRLYYLADGTISFWRCVKLIVIWEFSSAVSPSSLGGSAVSVFVLSHEKLGAPRTLAVIIYTVVLDSLFFVLSVPFLLLIFGANILYPSYHSLNDIDEVGYSLFFFYGLILVYGAFFAYGLFKNPIQFKKILHFFTRFSFLKRWNMAANKLGDDMIISANNIAERDFKFHFKSFFLTSLAWSCRFILVNCIIIALVNTGDYNFIDQIKIYGRQVVMFIFMMFSPTPGAAGFAEYFFGNYIGDYVPQSAALIIALIWRVLTYYAYLIAGVIIIPTWLTGVIQRRRAERNKD